MDDLISRQAAIDFVGSMNMCDEISNEAYKKLTSYLDELPPAEQDTTTHDSISAETGKNDGDRTSGDYISRQQAIDEIEKYDFSFPEYMERFVTELRDAMKGDLKDDIANLPSAQPEQHHDEWCVDCKEYDKEKHSCPRWNRVIRQTLLDAQPERKTGRWIEDAETYYKAVNEKGGGVNENTPYFTDCIACSECLSMFSVIDNETERFDFCPNCGAKMEGGEAE